MTTSIEHVNVTVRDPDKTADLLCKLFDWHVRWEGSSIHDGRSVHVGTKDQYVAVYAMPGSKVPEDSSYEQIGGLNHLGIQVDNLSVAKQRVLDAGYEPYNFGDYEPGRRFYFRDDDNIEFEILSYAGRRQMIPGISGAIDHVHVYVSSRKAAATWYREKLGFHVVEKFAFWATDEGGPLTIADAGGKIHFALFRSTEPKPVSLAFGASRNEYGGWKEHLKAKDMVFRESDHELSHSVYFNDPFGNQLEITTYDVD